MKRIICNRQGTLIHKKKTNKLGFRRKKFIEIDFQRTFWKALTVKEIEENRIVKR